MAYRSSSSAVSTALLDTVTVNKPAGVVAGDWLVFSLEIFGTVTVTWPFTPAATAFATTTGAVTRASEYATAVYQAGSSEPSTYTMSISGGNDTNPKVTCTAFSGRASSTPILYSFNEVASGSTPLTTSLVTGITAAAGDDIAFQLFGPDNTLGGPWVNTDPSGYTGRIQADDTSSAAAYVGFIRSITLDNTSGALGTLTEISTLSGHGLETAAIIVRLAAPSGGGTINPRHFSNENFF